MGSFDNYKSKSHMYCLFKNLKGLYEMYLYNYTIMDPVHNKSGNHPVIDCEFIFQQKKIININGMEFNINAIYDKNKN
jgi:hypothetical protein